ncbi:carbohydrate-binding module family 13 protein [Sphaerobolus stellatus SS14]|uniref:Carbohydrate-binding module family 13 protein n=1 Tax=Sphaerobolus stellatus (strain SS14) TaxID=990650 RepID=A0A0C9VPR0_SPHS4|nr:carbohydrate-binding module family 13 protein [Sphaerobolus stellatus SS14]
MSLGRGIYKISSRYYSVRIALQGGSNVDSTSVVAWGTSDERDEQLWLIEPVSGEADTYTVRNLCGGSYMDLSAAADGTSITGFHSTGSNSQKWVIRKESTNGQSWKIQNKATQTFADLSWGGTSNGTVICGWQGAWSDTNGQSHQQWMFDIQSRTASEVHASINNSSYISRDFESYLSDGLYLILPRQKIQSIWQNSGLGNLAWRNDIFDCDDFATVFKGEIAKWGNQTFKADVSGFAMLCGMMFGRQATGAHAYNWFVDSTDKSKIVFFEPQNGTYADNAWGYAGYFGLF